MLSNTKVIRSTVLAMTGMCALVWGSPSLAQINVGLTNIGAPNAVCIAGDADGTLGVSGTQDCDTGFTAAPQIQFQSGSALIVDSGATATFNAAVGLNSGGQLFGTFTGNATINATLGFNGSSVTFATPTTFTFPSTFQGATTFNGTTNFTAGMTTTSITNSGGIGTSSLNASLNLTASVGANIHMGGNVVHGVAAGVIGTDAVNVAQLNAATSGIATDITALETTTATHTTQIAAIQTVNNTQATQITALQAADMALDVRMDAMELLAEGLDDRIGKVDDRASAGTAAAVALSGAMFLPGKTFNLTGNVGSYRGAHAAALQFGALVSDNVAINAGIGHGFNKGGKTALRAGFTIGW